MGMRMKTRNVIFLFWTTFVFLATPFDVKAQFEGTDITDLVFFSQVLERFVQEYYSLTEADPYLSNDENRLRVSERKRDFFHRLESNPRESVFRLTVDVVNVRYDPNKEVAFFRIAKIKVPEYTCNWEERPMPNDSVTGKNWNCKVILGLNHFFQIHVPGSHERHTRWIGGKTVYQDTGVKLPKETARRVDILNNNGFVELVFTLRPELFLGLLHFDLSSVKWYGEEIYYTYEY